MTTQILITLYLLIGAFIAGNFLGDIYSRLDSTRDKVINIVGAIAAVFLGIPFLLYLFVEITVKKLLTIFQVKFFFKYFFTKKLNNIPHEILEERHKWYNREDDLIPLALYFWRLAARLTYKRNNFVPKED